VDEFGPAAAPAGGEVVALLELVERLVDGVPLGAEHAGDEGHVGDDLAAWARLPGEEDVDELGECGEPVVGEQVVADEESVEEDRGVDRGVVHGLFICTTLLA
jgi:hypothetical protein